MAGAVDLSALKQSPPSGRDTAGEGSATPAGIEVVKKVAIARDAAINDRLAAIPPSERAIFHATLWSIVAGGTATQK